MQKNKESTIHPWVIGLILIILCFASVIVFTLPSQYLTIDLTKKGSSEIGNVIGGITAPIIGIASAILIYMSFQQQIKANKIISDQYLLSNNFNRLIYLYAEFKEEISQIQFKTDSSEVFNGFQAFEKYLDIIQKEGDKYEEKGLNVALKNIINTFHVLVFKLENTELDKFDRMIIQNRINTVRTTIFWNMLTTFFINYETQNPKLIEWFKPTERKVEEIQEIAKTWKN